VEIAAAVAGRAAGEAALGAGCSPKEAAREARAAAAAWAEAAGGNAALLGTSAAQVLIAEYPLSHNTKPRDKQLALEPDETRLGIRAVEAARASYEPDLSWAEPSKRSPRRHSESERKFGSESGGEQDEEDPMTHKPAWMRKDLDKELQEIQAIEANAVAIRKGLQSLKEDNEGADVDAEAAALMLELKGRMPQPGQAARHSSGGLGDNEAIALLAELHGGQLPAWLAEEPARESQRPSSGTDRPWHVEVMRMRQALGELIKDD
ncbi:unnamed protein product, partial [Effrenium voratum]